MNIYIVDAFTNQRFTGNPAAVCILDRVMDDAWMQAVAREMNLSETAFLYQLADGYSLRWFTPTVEVDLCGHATLASAQILWESGSVSEDQVLRFHTKSGLLTAKKSGEWIELNFPIEADQPCEAPERLQEALGVPLLYVGKNRMDYIVEVENEETVRTLRPNLQLLEQIGSRGILVTSKANNPLYDFVSRCFFPAEGIPEDPVTGSAHCCLAPYWQRKLHKGEFLAAQVSARGGTIKVSIEGDRIRLCGQAVTVMKGNLEV